MPLDGLSVLVTRPRHQADELCALIRSSGGKPIAFPCIDIIVPRDTDTFTNGLSHSQTMDVLIFISTNAAVFYVDGLRAAGLPIPINPRLAAVGPATLRTMQALGLPVSISPSSDLSNSEALLQSPELMEVDTGTRVMIVRGESGREILAETLRERGAVVSYLAAYRRVIPASPDPKVLQALEAGQVDAITLTSVESLHNLITLVGDKRLQCMRRLPIVVISDRIRDAAMTAGFSQVTVTSAVNDQAIVESLALIGS